MTLILADKRSCKLTNSNWSISVTNEKTTISTPGPLGTRKTPPITNARQEENIEHQNENDQKTQNFIDKRVFGKVTVKNFIMILSLFILGNDYLRITL